MRRVLSIAVVLIAAFGCVGSAHAALPPAPGVAFVTASPINGYDWNVTYAGPGLQFGNKTPVGPVNGPVTGNRLRVEGTPDGHTITFEEPTTLMVVHPLQAGLLAAFGREQPCTVGFGRATCTVTAQRFCGTAIWGSTGPDRITVRYPHEETQCAVQVYTGRGMDQVDSRDGNYTIISCGDGIDRVEAEAGDVVHPDCEVVTRS